jgi:hypothetical protein
MSDTRPQIAGASVTPDASAACHNCGAPLYGRFCASCGQEARPINPTLGELARDATQEILDVDGRIFRTVRRLFLSPGFLTREYSEGRRAPWLPPVRLYLLFSVAYFALATFGDLNLQVTGQTDAETISAVQGLGFSSEEEMRAALSRAQAVWMPRVMFVLVPLFGWLVHLARRHSGRAYPQHLIFALHAHAAYFGVRALAAAARLAVPSVAASLAGALSVIYGMVYVVVGLQVAYGGTRRRAIRDAAIVLGLYGIAVIAATLGIVLPVLFWRR